MARVDFEHGLGGPAPRRGKLGELLLVPIETLRPTQVSVGMRAVVSKRRKFESRASKRKRMEKIISSRPIPAVRGPGGELFMIDHHHFGLALWQAEVEHAYARVIEDISDLTLSAFWRRMEFEGRLYPYDEEGRRIKPSHLPTCLHALRHDPFRDLAWVVREAGGFRKSMIPYAEFAWANFFRTRIPAGTVERNHDSAVDRAMRLSRCRAAVDLPGFVGEWE